jgi:hypothetical protein
MVELSSGFVVDKFKDLIWWAQGNEASYGGSLKHTEKHI